MDERNELIEVLERLEQAGLSDFPIEEDLDDEPDPQIVNDTNKKKNKKFIMVEMETNFAS